MLNFYFQLPTKVYFGKKEEEKVGKLIKGVGAKKVLLHYGSGSIKKYGLYQKIVDSLTQEGIDFIELGGVQPNPRLSLVLEGIALAKEHQVDFVLAVGGGSAIDSAKGIALGLANPDKHVWDFYSRKEDVTKCLPVGVVLTIPAAGSETSTSSVLTNEEGLYKRGVGSELLKPVFAIMNPELTYTLPNYQTACGITDMFAHIMERYFTNTTAVEVTDRMCEGMMKTIIHNAPIVLKKNDDYDARSEIMLAGSLAHNGLLSIGRVGDWASHGLEHELSALYDIAHGAGLAIIFPAWMKYVYQHDISRFVQFAHRVFDIEVNVFDLEETALKGIEALQNFFASIGMPTTFQEANLPTDDLELMAKKAVAKSLGQFVHLEEKDALCIYQLACG